MTHVPRQHALAFMVFCLLIAAALRLPDLADVPPGLHFDEAANGVLAAEIGLQGERPVFIESYTGKEALFFYLAGGLMRLLGASTFTLRLTAAFAGLLTIAASYRLGCELLSDRRIALLAAALIAVSFWHVLFSRLGFRAVTQPLLQALTVAILWRGLRRNSLPLLATAGLCLGLTAYTYLAARLFPLLLLIAIAPFLFGHNEWRQRWKHFALVTLIALIVLTPLLHFFFSHPDAFWVRINQVGPGTDNSRLGLRESFLKTLGMFFLDGDPYWRFNLPNRPLLDWFWGAFMILGWFDLLRRWRRQPTDWQRAAVVLLLLTPWTMILPSALATGEIVPSNLRAIGLIPFLFYLPAAGLLGLLDQAPVHWLRNRVTTAMILIGAIWLAAGGLATQHAYFNRWAGEPSLYFESDGDLTAVAHFLDELDVTDTSLFLAARHYQHPTLAFTSRHYEHIKWLPQSQALVFPENGPAIYVFPHSSPVPDWAAPYLGRPLSVPETVGLSGETAFQAYRLNQTPDLKIKQPAHVSFGHHITLLGYEVVPAAVGQRMSLTLFWKIVSAPEDEFNPFLHLEDRWQHRWSQVETFAYPSSQWEAGETMIQRIEIAIPPGTPPGLYRLRLGLFNGANGETLPVLADDGRYAGNSFFIEGLEIIAGEPPAVLPEPPVKVAQPVTAGLTLLGYERGAKEVAVGEPVPLALWWEATTKLPRLTSRLELIRPDNTGHILADLQPVHNTLPFALWSTPQFLIDRNAPRIPESFPPGLYRLNLRMLDVSEETVFTADLGPLQVLPGQRIFDAPATANPLNASFGREISLVGYDIEASAGQHNLRLVWRAMEAPALDYTVFVHLLHPDGTCCAWQQDTMPRQGDYPTGRWIADEVVIDSYLVEPPVDIPAGAYPLEIGLYVADTGQRLPVSRPGQRNGDALYLDPLIIP